MRSTASEIAYSKRTVQGVSRILGVFLALYGLYEWATYIEMSVRSHLRYGGVYPSFDLIKDTISWAPIALIAIGMVFIFRSAWIARLCVPSVPRPECPKCRYRLENFRADRCPECGLYLGEDFHAPPAPTQAETPSE